MSLDGESILVLGNQITKCARDKSIWPECARGLFQRSNAVLESVDLDRD